MSERAARAIEAAGRIGADLPEQPGMSGTVDVTVTGTADGDVHATLVLVDGRVTAASPGAPDAADLTLGLAAAEASAVADGGLAPSVAFMRGRLKTSGDNRLLLGVLALSAGPGWERWRSDLGAGGG